LKQLSWLIGFLFLILGLETNVCSSKPVSSKPVPSAKTATKTATPSKSKIRPTLYKDPIDEQIKKESKSAWEGWLALNLLIRDPSVKKICIFTTTKDREYLKKGEIDARVSKLLVQLAHHGHRLVVRIKDGYDEAHPYSRETAYPPGTEPNISAHYTGQAVDIFIADGVEIADQVSDDPLKQSRARNKIRQIIQEVFALGTKNQELLPSQILIYRPQDVRFFAQDVLRLYGASRAERGFEGLFAHQRFWDRIHIGY